MSMNLKRYGAGSVINIIKEDFFLVVRLSIHVHVLLAEVMFKQPETESLCCILKRIYLTVSSVHVSLCLFIIQIICVIMFPF